MQSTGAARVEIASDSGFFGLFSQDDAGQRLKHFDKKVREKEPFNESV